MTSSKQSPAGIHTAPRLFLLSLLALVGLSLGACSSMPPLATVDRVDLDRFMGDWYVIAHIPTLIEKDAYNAVETYALNDDGTVATTFTFNEGSFDGEQKTYNPKGFPDASTNNAVWGMRFIWPIKADYRVVYLDEAYSVTIIGRNKRDYVWLMAREPEIPESRYQELMQLIEGMGYDLAEMRKVPQHGAAQ
ncbi:MAG: lipocalin family protein [Xanthomonadales bacterium]|jgi:apolipoprotein D and lipocalin family protein|nr:lipocalin family protein [Xanthomonadales bacterium]